jgi:translation initiation factor 2 subunit 3
MYAVPGGLIAVGTNVDPFITKADKLVGNVIGHPDKLPDVFRELEAKITLMTRLAGVKTNQA